MKTITIDLTITVQGAPSVSAGIAELLPAVPTGRGLTYRTLEVLKRRIDTALYEHEQEEKGNRAAAEWRATATVREARGRGPDGWTHDDTGGEQ